MVSNHQWSKGNRPPGHRTHKAHGLCDLCYKRSIRPNPREFWTAEEMLEEYQMIRDDVASIRQAAERMGIKFSRLDRALYRARKRGDSRGNAPLDQINRAIQWGSPAPVAKEAA
jgi:transposase-like protein